MTQKLSRDQVLRIRTSGWANKAEREALCDMALEWLEHCESEDPAFDQHIRRIAREEIVHLIREEAAHEGWLSSDGVRSIVRTELHEARQQTINAAVAKALLEFGKLAPAYWNRAHQRAAELEAGE